ncbi:DUF2922 domain-containing protein [Alicyclobacillaceae bacterium I2511]|jgi:hypothetical protein|nr:DUF2922 domain-containing protein [Alicyclobacillaceae bacterium I2511]
MTTKVVLQLDFLTNQNKRVRINVPNPKLPIDNTAVTAAMDAIVSKGIFAFPQGKIASKVGANQVQTDTNTIV